MHAVMVWRQHVGHLAVSCHLQTSMGSRNPNFLSSHRREVFLVAQASDERTQRQSYQCQPSGAIRDVETQLSTIESFPRTDVESFHRVLVVADEDERRATVKLGPADHQPDINKRITTQHRYGRPYKCRPLAPPKTLLFLSFLNDVRIKTQTRVVNEYPPVNFANIDRDDMAIRYRS